MKEIEMTMQEFCDVLGITAQTVRLYEKHDALPVFKYKNGYRYYYFEDLGPSIAMRNYRKIGVSIKDAAFLCNGVELDTVQSTLEQRKEQMLEEYRRQGALLKHIEETQKSLESVIGKLDRFEWGVRPAMYHLLCERDGNILNKPEEKELLRIWSDNFPFVRFCPVMWKEDVKTEGLSRAGFCVYEEESCFVAKLDSPLVTYLPEKACIMGVTRVETQIKDYYSIISKGLQSIRLNGYELDGDIYTVLIASRIKTYEPEEIVADYHYIWYPVKKVIDPKP